MTSELHHLAAAYALDALDDAERRDFEAHYPSCDICRADVASYQRTTERLAQAATTDPPDTLRQDVMSAIGTTRQLSPLPQAAGAGAESKGAVIDLAQRRQRTSRRILAAAAGVLVMLAGALAYYSIRTGDEVGELLASPDAVVVDLDGEVGMLRVVWSIERNEAAVVATDLPAAGTGLDYALWYLPAEGAPQLAALFDSDDGYLNDVLELHDRATGAAEVVGWGVTIEPETGSEQPTTPVIYSGSI